MNRDLYMTKREKTLVMLMAAIQFIDALEYQIIAPLAPDIASDLNFPITNVASITGAYSLSAILASILGVFWIDHFDRRTALCVAMIGLLLSTILTAFSPNFEVLIGARFFAGFFGGLATTLITIVITDSVKPEHRGQALGRIMASFIAAAMIGVPFCLQMTLIFSWRTSFFVLAVTGILLTIIASRFLPKLREHMQLAQSPRFSFAFVFQSRLLLSCALITSITLSGALLAPNFSAYLQYNLAFPREQLGMLFMFGALASFIALRTAGRLTDRIGTFKVTAISQIVLIATLSVAYIFPELGVSVWIWFPVLGVSGAIASVSAMTLVTLIPHPNERGTFMSATTAARHGATAAGAFLSVQLLGVTPSGQFIHFPVIGVISVCFAIVSPFLVSFLNRKYLK